ncbi:hypothetical protein N665_1544s0002 [Sinapis alba]|nr:hypothetical protein N665_1544s0002 [Sinapis alba]
MKATTKLSYMSGIRPYKLEWWVQVKVLHTWKQHSEYGGGYRPTNHPFKLSFMKFTSIDSYEDNNVDMIVDLVEFESILSGQLDNNLLIDEAQMGVVVFIFFDMTNFKCDPSNMSIVESNDSDNQIVRHGKVIKIDTWDPYDDKNVAELLSSTQFLKKNPFDLINHINIFKTIYLLIYLYLSTQIGKCKVVCTIYAIDTVFGWYYFGCDICNTKTYKIEDHELLPLSLKDVLEKTFKFGVDIEKNNVAYGSESYKVSKVWSINNMLMVDSQSETKSALETTVSLLTDNEESSAFLQTPTSNRSKDDKDEVHELTSASKKATLKKYQDRERIK